MSTISFELKSAPPFRLDLTAWVLRRRPGNIIDRWDGRTYRRVLVIRGKSMEVAVTQPMEVRPLLEVTVRGEHLGPETQPVVEAALQLLLGTGADLSAFYRFARRDARLWLLVERFRGLKPPQFPTVFEAVVNAIACQQLTLTVGIILLNRLAEAYGKRFEGGNGAVYSFPLPEYLAQAKPDALRKLGFSRQKTHALIELSQKITDKAVNLEELKYMDDEVALKHLRELCGIGRWSADYVLLRGLRRIHIFPADDVGGRNKLRRVLNLRKPLDYEGTHRVLARWRPYGGLIYFHLLLKSLEEEGMLQ